MGSVFRNLRPDRNAKGTGTTVTERSQAQADVDRFWSRFGWWVSGVWIIFLIYPTLTLLQEDFPVALRVIGLSLILVYAAAYLRGYGRFSWTVGHGGSSSFEAYAYFGTMAAIMFASIPILHDGALGLLPFLTSYSAFLLKRKVMYVTYAVALILSFGLPLAYGVFLQQLFLTGLNVMLMVIYFVTSGTIRRAVAADMIKDEFLVLSEQERMARDVHDGVGHSLTALNLKAQLALRLLDEGEVQKARSEVEQLSELALMALDSVRTTVHGMARADLEGELQALACVCADSGIEFNVVGRAEAIPHELRSHVSWIVRESLTNVLRHAHASGVWVSLSEQMLSIDDDGDGLQNAKEGHGLRGMRERARLFGASCTVGESKLGGTSIRIDFGTTGVHS
ncbi:hypothetical protein CQ017_04760 [Arthrobacter sp. MYb224]|nr:hypothetical protein CQ017_04760 [Arthrobacter sp. MYb224]